MRREGMEGHENVAGDDSEEDVCGDKSKRDEVRGKAVWITIGAASA